MFETLDTHPAVLVQGATGKHGRFHTEAMLAAGARVVAGVTPGGAGKEVSGVPVYDTVHAAMERHADIAMSVVFVPAAHAKAALLEAIEARVKLVVCITEGVPVHDVLAVTQRADELGVRLIGPNSPGLLVPGAPTTGKYGIIPASIGLPGDTTILSRSGTLAYEVTHALSEAAVGQRAVIGIGGDPIKGMTFVDCLEELAHDASTKRIVLVGEIGGQDEQQAAEYLKKHPMRQEVYAYVAGRCAPLGTQLGHAGAIVRSDDETVEAKLRLLEEAGVRTAASVEELVGLI